VGESSWAAGGEEKGGGREKTAEDRGRTHDQSGKEKKPFGQQ